MITKEEYQEALEQLRLLSKSIIIGIDFAKKELDLLQELIDNLKDNENENRRIVD